MSLHRGEPFGAGSETTVIMSMRAPPGWYHDGLKRAVGIEVTPQLAWASHLPARERK
jgi:hypothetical protein